MAGWQTTVGNLQNICFQYKVFDENLLWKVHTAGRLTGSQVRVRIVDAWTSSPSKAVSSSHDNYHNGGAGDAEDGGSDEKFYLRTVLSFLPVFPPGKTWKCLLFVSRLVWSFSCWLLGSSLNQKAQEKVNRMKLTYRPASNVEKPSRTQLCHLYVESTF